MSELFKIATENWTPGGIGIWLLLASTLGIWWKGLPSVMQQWHAGVDKEREHREREITRLEKQIIASDDRHEECMAGQARLREEIDRLRAQIAGLVAQISNIQLSANPGALPPEFIGLLTGIDTKEGRA